MAVISADQFCTRAAALRG